MANPDDNSVVITGLGPVTAVGIGNEFLWASLKAGRSALQPRTLPVDLGRMGEFHIAAMPPADQIDGLDLHLAFLAEQECEGYRDLAYTLLAVELALEDAGLQYNRDTNNIGLIQAFEAPGAEHTVQQLFGLFSQPLPTDAPPPVYELLARRFYSMQPFHDVHMLGKALGLHGFSTSVHNACASGAFAIEVAAQRIREGLADVMIVAGGEAFDTGVRLEWFRRLGVYAEDGIMRPLDGGATGFCVGEGAGAIILESTAHAARRGATSYARYLGGGFAQQGWKQTIPDVRAARLRHALSDVLERTGTATSEIDLVVPHAACTPISDRYETDSVEQVLGPDVATATATAFKPYVGHLLAASGVIESVCALLAMKHQTVPATLNSRPGQVRCAVPVASEPVERPIRTLLKLATGFTGHDAGLIFQRDE